MNKIIKNASWIIICRIVQSLLGFIISMMSARYLGPSNYGIINYAQSLVVFVTPVMLLGFNNIIVQEVVNDPDKEGEIMGTALSYSVVSSFVCAFAVCAFAYFFNNDDRVTVIVCFLFTTNLIFQALDQIEYWYQAKLLSKYSSIVGLFAYTVVSIYRLYLLFTHKSVYWFAISYSLDYLIISAMLIAIYKKLGGQAFSVSSKCAKRMFRKSKSYIAAAMMITVFTQTDKIMLNEMVDSSATGFYSAAVVLSGITTFVFQAIIDSFRPKLFEDIKEDVGKYESGMVMLYNLIIYASLIQCVCMTLLAKPIVQLTYGEGYMQSVAALRIVVWVTTFSYIGVVRNIWILTEDKQRYLTPINTCGAISNVVLNFIFIPIMGINGAALASLLSQFITNVGTGFIFKAIRHNNTLMFRALEPQLFLKTVKIVMSEIFKRRDNTDSQE